MKNVLLLSLLSAVTTTAFAAAGLSATEAQDSVVTAAHHFIANNAPDFGGKVDSPCSVNLSGDQYTVTCTGVADETTAGDGDVKVRFQCVGEFVQGHDGQFSLTGKVRCEEK